MNPCGGTLFTTKAPLVQSLVSRVLVASPPTGPVIFCHLTYALEFAFFFPSQVVHTITSQITLILVAAEEVLLCVVYCTDFSTIQYDAVQYNTIQGSNRIQCITVI